MTGPCQLGFTRLSLRLRRRKRGLGLGSGKFKSTHFPQITPAANDGCNGNQRAHLRNARRRRGSQESAEPNSEQTYPLDARETPKFLYRRNDILRPSLNLVRSWRKILRVPGTAIIETQRRNTDLRGSFRKRTHT